MSPRKRMMIIMIISGTVLAALLLWGVITGNGGYISPQLEARNQGPSWAHPFGTDWMGRDMLSRTLGGLSLSFMVGFIAAVMSVVIATLLSLFVTLGKTADRIVT